MGKLLGSIHTRERCCSALVALAVFAACVPIDVDLPPEDPYLLIDAEPSLDIAPPADVGDRDDAMWPDSRVDAMSPDVAPPPDARPDAGADARLDATPDARPDVLPDATPDARLDATPDAGPDADPDSGPDAGCPLAGAEEICGIAEGRCQTGIRVCGADGEWGPCEGAVVPADELCNAEDDDCDGAVDEELMRSCGSELGDCELGEELCTQGEWGSCEGGVGPTEESCDGRDNDCDGTVDEDAQQACYTGTVGTAGTGECREGQQQCVDGELGACDGAVIPTDERCNQADDDCDGEIDENFDVQTDALNCGTCGTACDDGADCCGGQCRPLDTADDCGACDAACLERGDRCIVDAGVARCECGNEGRACEGGEWCVDGQCRCANDDDCGENQLCCDQACVDTDVGRCAACDGGACDPVSASACVDRTCVCGASGSACADDVVCGQFEAGGEYACLVCLPSSCAGVEALCCPEGCLGIDVAARCESCDEGCELDRADTCRFVDDAESSGGVCACGEAEEPCAPAPLGDGAPWCAEGVCIQCRDDGDCGAQQPLCIDRSCVACDPTAADPAAYLCVEGEAAPICDGEVGDCRGCVDDGECAARPGPLDLCADGVCRICDPTSHRGCAPDSDRPICDTFGLACGRCDSDQQCDTIADNGGQCVDGRCIECDSGTATGDGCDPIGPLPVCDADTATCRECGADDECSQNPNNPERCVFGTCRGCNPEGDVGCGEQEPAPICDVLTFECRECRGDDECERRLGDLDRCANGRCSLCNPNTGDGCAESGANPICDADDVACRRCEGDDECDARLGRNNQCVDGQCRFCDPDEHAPCDEASNLPICDPDFLSCRVCLEDAECRRRPGGLDFCDVDTGSCVECVAADHAGCDESGDRPFCDPEARTCRACESGDECGARPGERNLCVHGRCGLCDPTTHDGCDEPADQPFCDAERLACRPCTADAECEARPGDLDVCLTGRCRACDPDGGRGCDIRSVAPVCEPATADCRPCVEDTECSASRYTDGCDEGTGLCVCGVTGAACDDREQCRDGMCAAVIDLPVDDGSGNNPN